METVIFPIRDLKPLDISAIKQHLSEAGEKRFVVLDDLTGPTGLSNGQVILARSRAIPRDWDERKVSEAIMNEADWVAFYEAQDAGHPSYTYLRLALGKFEDIGLKS